MKDVQEPPHLPGRRQQRQATSRFPRPPTRWPSLSSSPWMRWYPQPWFSVASRSMSAVISALIGGRPVWFG